MIKANILNNFFKKVYLNGIVDHCKVTTYDDGLWLVEAIDEKTSVLLSCQADIMKGNEWDLGIGDLSLLMRWLSIVGSEEIDIKKKDNKLILKSKTKGNLNYLLQEIDFIRTQMDAEGDKSSLDKLIDLVDLEVKLTKDVRENLTSVMGVIKPEIVSLKLDKGNIHFAGGSANEHSFDLPIGKIKSKEKFELSIEGNALLNVLSVIDEDPILLFKEDIPPVIKEGEDNIWSINVQAQGE